MFLGQEISAFLWTKLATDIFQFEGDSNLLIVDYTSRYPVICKLTSMTTQNVIGHLKVIFSEYGWPDPIVSDNGPCYTTMQEYQVNHIILFTPLSPVKWACREVCTNSEKLIP